ncbi:hypothetical protein [Planctomicrobium sp. SH664]|uniref:hypothetical protein n=1 Tax=Planctomicrobium sp. SH664 TaxID=3448125 RepID=UPI003F5B0E30
MSGYNLHERETPRELGEKEDQGLSLPGRWVNSHQLFAGDILIGQDGRQRRVLKTEQTCQELFPVSNLTIEEHHSFAVGPDAILVHNTGGCGPAGGPYGKVREGNIGGQVHHTPAAKVTPFDY